MAPIAEIRLHRPPAAVAHAVDGVVAYRFEGFPPGLHTGLPSRHLTLIISLAGPVRLVRAPGRSGPLALDALVGGLHAGPATIAHGGCEHGVQLRLRPLGARALLGVPAAALANTVEHLDDVVGPVARDLRERMLAVEGWPARLAVLDAALLRLLGDAPAPHPGVRHAWERICARGGGEPIAGLAADLGWSRRHLGDRFRAEVGIAPKTAARIVRLERARDLLVRPARPSLAAVAAACGYADQAHMARDWRELAGAAPSAWLASELLPFVQDDDGAAA